MTNNRTVNLGGLSVVVNGYEAKDDNDLADTIVHRINDMLNEDDSVWGKYPYAGVFAENSQKMLAIQSHFG